LVKPRNGAEERGGAMFRPLGTSSRPSLSHGSPHAMGYLLPHSGCGILPLRSWYAQISAHFFGICNIATFKSRTLRREPRLTNGSFYATVARRPD
jgi:hypothetical protein